MTDEIPGDAVAEELKRYKAAWEHLCANTYDHNTPYMICIPSDEWAKAELLLSAD